MYTIIIITKYFCSKIGSIVHWNNNIFRELGHYLSVDHGRTYTSYVRPWCRRKP